MTTLPVELQHVIYSKVKDKSWYLVGFDSELFFHNDRNMYSNVCFQNFGSKEAISSFCLEQPELRHTIFTHLGIDLDDIGDNISNYPAEEKKFFEDIGKQYGHTCCTGYILVPEDDVIFGLLSRTQWLRRHNVMTVKNNT